MASRSTLFLLPWFLTLALACGPAPSGSDSSPIATGEDPMQEEPEQEVPMHLSQGGWEFTLTPLASYRLSGVVLSTENYYSGWNALLSPCDVAMAWGDLTQGELWEKLSWSQGGRWYYWEFGSDFPHENDFVSRYSCNAHIIPASENLKRAARGLSEGDLAELTGELVKVEGRKGDQTVWWTSSLSRKDTGDGSCEVLYLRKLRTRGEVYE